MSNLSQFATKGHSQPLTVLETAQAAVRAGISVIPVAFDGSKSPVIPWKELQSRLATAQELIRWFRPNRCGLAVVCGPISHNLECVDFDRHDLFARFAAAARLAGLGDLIDRIKAGYFELSPRGCHLVYRCSKIEGNQALALTHRRNPDGTIATTDKGKKKTKALIETRREGGYFIAAPTHGSVHPSGNPYVCVSGGFDQILTITEDERAQLHALARTFTEVALPPPMPPRPASPKKDCTRPGDDFNQWATWEEILLPYDWVVHSVSGEVTYWCRPDKDPKDGHSATTNFAGLDLFHVFTTGSDFEADRSYTKFFVFATLRHDGDFHAAAAELAALGYGTRGGWGGDEGLSFRLPSTTQELDAIWNATATRVAPPVVTSSTQPPSEPLANEKLWNEPEEPTEADDPELLEELAAMAVATQTHSPAPLSASMNEAPQGTTEDRQLLALPPED